MTALCLRLTLFATSLTAQGCKTPETAGRMPTLVRLGKGEVQARTCTLMAEMLSLLPNDPALDKKSCVHRLLLTEAHIIIRFNQYLWYPARIWMLSRKYNPDLYGAEIVSFLRLDDQDLDGGYSLLLQKEAWRHAGGVEAAAVSYLMAEDIQVELDAIVSSSSGTSLEVERKHKQDKQGETTKVTSCASASRNSILARYLLCRKTNAGQRVSLNQKKRHVRFMNVRALAIMQNPDLMTRGRGRLKWEAEDSMSHGVSHQGDEAKLQQYIKDNEKKLEEELQTMRDKVSFQELQVHAMPVTFSDWMQYMGEHDEEFRESLKHATLNRRTLSERLKASEQFGDTIRVYPAPSARRGHSPHWSHVGQGFFVFLGQTRPSWLCIRRVLEPLCMLARCTPPISVRCLRL